MNLRNLSILFLAASFLLISCGEDPVCDVLADTLPGTWNVTNLAGTSGEIVLNADGSLEDSDNILIEYENNGVMGDIKTWSLSDSTDLTFTAMIDPTLGSGSASVTTSVTSFDCDQVTLDVGGFGTINLTK